MSKILFLDIDGPMIPSRAAILTPGNGIWARFDPVAVAHINDICKQGVKIVLSSSWRSHGVLYCGLALAANGIDTGFLHTFWCTKKHRGPLKTVQRRAAEIKEWLKEVENGGEEVTHWAAIDDIDMGEYLENFVHVNTLDGIMLKHVTKLHRLLGVGFCAG